jgi:hypothetical protein
MTPGLPLSEANTRGTTVASSTLPTSLIRLSALGTAQFSSEPTKGDADVPEPLPNAPELTDGCAVSEAVPDEVALVAVVVCGVIAVSIGTVICALSLVRLEPDVAVPDVVDAPVALEATVPPVLVAPVVVPVVLAPVAPVVALVAAPVVAAVLPAVDDVAAVPLLELYCAPAAVARAAGAAVGAA